MGYTTDFDGEFSVSPKLDPETHNFLSGLSATRRMNRRVDSKYGIEGEFFVPWDDLKNFGQTHSPDIIYFNSPPRTQPGLWLQWEPTEDGEHIRWNGAEKFYNYIEWLEYIIENILKPRGYTVNGQVYWRGEDFHDSGVITVKDNHITPSRGH
jgi:hypothetical protein